MGAPGAEIGGVAEDGTLRKNCLMRREVGGDGVGRWDYPLEAQLFSSRDFPRSLVNRLEHLRSQFLAKG